MFTYAGAPSTTRTLRIKKESDLILEREAERHGLSVNALVSNLVDRYVNSLRYFQSGGMLSMSNETLLELLSHISDEDISDTAYRHGSVKIRDSLMQRGMKLNYDNVVWYINQILGQYNGWFRCDHNREMRMDTLHLSHSYGYKWSIFISNYVKSILIDVIGLKTNTVVSNNAVNIEIIK
jgi:hypothetical protein